MRQIQEIILMETGKSCEITLTNR